ncbi:glycine cleavage system aminomethyltransferase GcvT, partial [bacterium]
MHGLSQHHPQSVVRDKSDLHSVFAKDHFGHPWFDCRQVAWVAGTLYGMSADALSRTPLYNAHLALGGRIVPFAGFEMPVQYSGILAETAAVRERVGMFDVSHMGRLDIEGDGALKFLERVTSNDVSKLEDGRGQYSLLPNAEGGTVDDIIVYRLAEDRYRMVVNASNHAKDLAWLRSHDAEGVIIDDVTAATCLIAVQGPQAVEVVASLADDPEPIRQAPFFGTVSTTMAGVPVFAARSGYTGEDGYELTAPAAQAEDLWKALLEAGVTPCGLGSRDTLRVEAGLPLYGHELSDDLSPIAAGLGWVVSKTKHFIGSEPINKARTEGVARRLVGVALGSKRLIPTGATVMVDGRTVGEVSSGVVSPTLGTA